MVGAGILARAGWSCLPGDTTRPRALAGVAVAHAAMRCLGWAHGKDEEDCDPPAAATPVSRAR
jgi:hypothetical protein